MTENELSRIVYNAGLKVHKSLGPGLLESAYEQCLFYELTKQGIFVERQKPMPLHYEEIVLDSGFRVDMMVENSLILEIKACEEVSNLHFAQLLTYLKLSGCKLGLLINFNTFLFKNGVRRVINGTL